MIRITLYSGPSDTDTREAAISLRTVDTKDVSETLRQIGLEWKNADYMGSRQVIITLDPVVELKDSAEFKKAIDDLREALDNLG